MELTSEDALRLNVLLASKPQAIRIDESSMTLYGLSDKGEAKIKLHPTCRDDQYLKVVREVLSGNVLGSPGGYPVYLQRWTRMGQTRDESLEQLLQLGEPEAVVAVTCAAGLTNELARRAWWTAQDPDNARRMLRNPQVVQGRMGGELARFLIEYLPFETEPEVTVESLTLALQPGLLDPSTTEKLWSRCSRKPTYYLGFLRAVPDDLPEVGTERALADDSRAALDALAATGNPFARILLKIFTAQGQAFLQVLSRVMDKPANQEVVSMLLEVIRNYFSSLRPTGDPDMTLEELIEDAEQLVDSQELARATASVMQGEGEVRALWVLSGLGFGVVRPVFRKTDAIGSLMRRKLEPITQGVEQQIQRLRNP